jgi:hypothetical protein
MKRGRIRITPSLYQEAKRVLPQELTAVARDIIIDYIANGVQLPPKEPRAGSDLQVLIDEDYWLAAQQRARSENIGLREVVEAGLTRKLRELSEPDARDS